MWSWCDGLQSRLVSIAVRYNYEELKAQGLSQRAIAERMGMPEATLRNNLKVLAQAVAQTVGEGIPTEDQGLPSQKNPEVHLGTREGDPRDTPRGAPSIPPHPGCAISAIM